MSRRARSLRRRCSRCSLVVARRRASCGRGGGTAHVTAPTSSAPSASTRARDVRDPRRQGRQGHHGHARRATGCASTSTYDDTYKRAGRRQGRRRRRRRSSATATSSSRRSTPAAPRLADGARIPLDRHRGAGRAGPDLLQPRRPRRRARPEGRQQERRAVPAARRRRRQPRRRGRASSTRPLTDLSQALGTLSDGRGDLFGTVRNLQVFTTALADSDQPGARVQHRPGQRRRPARRRARRARARAEEPRGRARRGGVVRQGQPDEPHHRHRRPRRHHRRSLAKQKDALAEVLDAGPVALSNLQNAYNPASGTLDTRDNAAAARTTRACSSARC